ncbi:MAG: protein kinase domain-containing protein [Coraliomargarita sp.]
MHIQNRFSVRYGQASEAGVKERNEDCLGITIPEGDMLGTKGIVVVLADGVSAAEAGGEAAEMCVRSFINDYYSTPETWQVKTAGHRVLVAINRWLFSKGQTFSDAHKGYVCAMSAMVLKSRSAHIFHVGDARIYRLRDGQLDQLTDDHRTRVSERTSYLARAMGLGTSLDVDYRQVPIEPGDYLLLCTDGVHEHVPEKELARFVNVAGQDLDGACAKIVAQALAEGSRDNVSCQVLAVDSLADVGANEVYDELGRLPFPPPLEVGMVLDGYVVERVLDESARSQLYVVKDTEGGERAVMKTPAERFSDDAAYIERFLMEEWVGRRISNSRLVKVVEKRRTPQFLFYLMEHVEGRTLAKWIEENPQPEMGVVIHMIEQVIGGVRALHRKETLHQDLKPDNIILDCNEQVKIIDYGSAYVAGINEAEVPFERRVDLGTRCFSAPEYVLNRRPSTRSDLFSIGVIAYQLFTGSKEHPYGEAWVRAQTVGDFSKLKYVSALQHNPMVPGWIDGALRKAVSVSPEGRYPVLSEFLADLQSPNPEFLSVEDAPLIRRNPLLFWRGLVVVQAVVILILLILLGAG